MRIRIGFRIQLYTLVRIRMRIRILFDADANPDLYLMRIRILILIWCGSGSGYGSRLPNWCGSGFASGYIYNTEGKYGTSGGWKAGVPWLVVMRSDWAQRSSCSQTPKSAILRRPARSSSRLPGLISLWMMPWKHWSNCKCNVISVICRQESPVTCLDHFASNDFGLPLISLKA